MSDQWLTDCLGQPGYDAEENPRNRHLLWEELKKLIWGDFQHRYGLRHQPGDPSTGEWWGFGRGELAVPSAEDRELLESLYDFSGTFLEWASSLHTDTSTAELGLRYSMPEYETPPGPIPLNLFRDASEAREFLDSIRHERFEEHLRGYLPDLRPNTVQTKFYDFLRDCLFAQLAVSNAQSTCAMADRAVSLLDKVVDVNDERVRAYLGRVAQCYLRDMATEGVVMCRAVLEAAVKDRLKDVPEQDIRLNVPKCGKHLSLLNYLTYAKNHTPFLPHDDPDPDGKSTWTVAIEVKDAGDNAVHAMPGLSDLDTKLRQLVRVLEHMFPESPQQKAQATL